MFQATSRSSRIPLVVILCIALLVAPIPAAAASGFELKTVSGPDEVRQGGSLTVRITVENEALGEATEPVTLWIDRDGDDRQDADEPSTDVSPTLDPVESRTLLVSVSTEALTAGDYSYRVRSGDDAVERPVTVLGPPVSADAGPNRTVRPGTTITLDGTGSRDANGSSLSYIWRHETGPIGELSDANTATPNLTVPPVDSPHTMVYKLTVLDGDGNRDTDTVGIAVRPRESGIDAERRVDGVATPGRELNVTLTARFDELQERVAVFDGYAGPISDARIVSITSDDSPLGSHVKFSSITTESMTVAIEDVPKGTLEVEYALTISPDAADGERIDWTGSEARPDVSAETASADFGTEGLTIGSEREKERDGKAVGKADANGDGSISDSELVSAVTDWASGEYDDAELNRIVIAWSTK